MPKNGLPSCIVITGASSGIGRALAARYATPGRTLALLARDAARLHDVEALCRDKGAAVVCNTIDVRDRERLGEWLITVDRSQSIDLVIANAGVMGGVRANEPAESADESQTVFDTNLGGVLNTVQPILPLMLARRSGQIAIVSSIAGFIPLPDAPSYGASKAALISYGLALQAGLAGSGVAVSTICPGYVSTAMTAQESGRKPFLMSAEDAADRIVQGLSAEKALITFPWFFSMLTRIGGALPQGLRVATQSAFRFKVGDRQINAGL